MAVASETIKALLTRQSHSLTIRMGTSAVALTLMLALQTTMVSTSSPFPRNQGKRSKPHSEPQMTGPTRTKSSLLRMTLPTSKSNNPKTQRRKSRHARKTSTKTMKNSAMRQRARKIPHLTSPTTRGRRLASRSSRQENTTRLGTRRSTIVFRHGLWKRPAKC